MLERVALVLCYGSASPARAAPFERFRRFRRLVALAVEWAVGSTRTVKEMGRCVEKTSFQRDSWSKIPARYLLSLCGIRGQKPVFPGVKSPHL